MNEIQCTRCHARYDVWPDMCAFCGAERGHFAPVFRRALAAMDAVPARSNALALSRMRRVRVPHTAYPDIQIGAKSITCVHGSQGQGKTTLMIQLLNSIPGTVLYLSAEQGVDTSFSECLGRCKVMRADFEIIARCSVDQFVEHVHELKAVAACIDSVQVSDWTPQELKHALALCPSLDALFVICQQNKAGEMAGSKRFAHDADIVILVEAMKWQLEKSRYQIIEGVSGDVLEKTESLTEAQNVAASL